MPACVATVVQAALVGRATACCQASCSGRAWTPHAALGHCFAAHAVPLHCYPPSLNFLAALQGRAAIGAQLGEGELAEQVRCPHLLQCLGSYIGSYIWRWFIFTAQSPGRCGRTGGCMAECWHWQWLPLAGLSGRGAGLTAACWRCVLERFMSVPESLQTLSDTVSPTHSVHKPHLVLRIHRSREPGPVL